MYAKGEQSDLYILDFVLGMAFRDNHQRDFILYFGFRSDKIIILLL